MKTASRTLVKSPPEVWEQLDHPGRMEGLMCALVGHATDVQVYARVEESKLAWKADGDEARIEIELAERGWGTNVSVSAETGAEPTRLGGWLDAVLDELATPQKRPFEGMKETPSGTVAEALSSATAPEPGPPVQRTAPEEPEEPDVEEPKAEEPEEPDVEEPKAEEPEEPDREEPKAEEPPPVSAPEPEPAPRKKRFFGLL